MKTNFLIKFFALLVWTGLIFVAIGLPMQDFSYNNGEQEVTFFDKGIHLVIFGVFAFLVAISIDEIKKLAFRHLLVLSVVVTTVYAIFTEYYQSFVPGRETSEFDLISGVVGAFLGMLYYYMMTHPRNPKLLLHICCIGCGAYVSQELLEKFNLVLYFYNPNIFPRSEYDKRLEEIRKVAKKEGMKVVVADYNHDGWRKKIKGKEQEPERGERCWVCYRDRLEGAALYARERGFSFFATTLSVSPHKDAEKLNEIGRKLEKKLGAKYYEADFKKNGGYQRSVALSKVLGLYRQDYCGCEFSLADRNQRQSAKKKNGNS